MHFPIETLRDKIKNLFEASVPTETHKECFENGLSPGLKFHEMDTVVDQPAYNDSGFDEGSCKHQHYIHISDNFIQFMWMLAYSAISEYDNISLYFRDIQKIVN